MGVADLIGGIVARLAPKPPKPLPGMSTPEDIRWQRRTLEALKREARMLGVEVDLQRAGQEQ